MSVRQAARRLQCQNKMRQFGIALTLYESAYQHFPSGKTSEPKYSGFSWSAQLLPWLEEEPLWNSLVEFGDAAAIDGIPVNRLGLSTHLLHVHCPSNSETATVQRAMNLNGTYVGLTDYQGVAGRNFRSKDGVFFLDSKTKISQIGDGLSNTFFIGNDRRHLITVWVGGLLVTGKTAPGTLICFWEWKKKMQCRRSR